MKKWENPKKILPVLGFLPTAVLAVCIAVSLGDYTAPVLSLDAAGSETGTQTGTLTTEKRKERKTAAVTTKAPAPAVTPVSESGTYRDGTYTGTGTGFSGPITVQVVIEGGKIKDITVVSSTDDSPYLQNASALLKQIVALQSTNVDTVSGATYSSVGLISAVRDALQKAGGSSASDSALPILAASESQNKTGENAPAVEAIAEPAAYRDGVYTGTGTGFGGQMTVQVTVSGGKITDIQVLSSKDDSPYLQNACALLQNIIASQSTNVDAVSGATYRFRRLDRSGAECTGKCGNRRSAGRNHTSSHSENRAAGNYSSRSAAGNRQISLSGRCVYRQRRGIWRYHEN